MTGNDNAPSDRAANAAPKRACPICGKPRAERYNPFCSKRCADIDLHRWLKGSYVIPAAEPGSASTQNDADED
jgi:endogenous inhibitor of DNA gyrase (YacG/DUF329 family)